MIKLKYDSAISVASVFLIILRLYISKLKLRKNI